MYDCYEVLITFETFSDTKEAMVFSSTPDGYMFYCSLLVDDVITTLHPVPKYTTNSLSMSDNI